MPQQLEELGFTCGACAKQFRWKPELAGRSVTCKCETTIKVPAEAGGVDPDKTSVKQFNEIKQVAVENASNLSPERKQELIAIADASGEGPPEDVDSLELGGGALFELVIFGAVKPTLFLIGALFLAFRTASGSVSG